MPNFELVTTVAVIALATLTTRALPFLLLYKISHHPMLQYLGRYLPPMIMVLLVLYSLKDSISMDAKFAPHLIGVASVIVLHLLVRQPLLSIVGGTGCYMFALRWLA